MAHDSWSIGNQALDVSCHSIETSRPIQVRREKQNLDRKHTEMKIKRAGGIVEVDETCPCDKPEANTPDKDYPELANKQVEGIQNMASDIGESIELRLRDMVTAAVAACQKPEHREGALALLELQVRDLMQNACDIVVESVKDEFKFKDHFAETIPGNYSVLL